MHLYSTASNIITERVSEALNIPRLEGIQKKSAMWMCLHQLLRSMILGRCLVNTRCASSSSRDGFLYSTASNIITERVSEALNIPRLEGIQKKARQSISYVDVPPPAASLDDIGALFGQYKVREFLIKRWIPHLYSTASNIITERVSEALNIPRLEGIQKKARQSSGCASTSCFAR
jgi:hypothetical protein